MQTIDELCDIQGVETTANFTFWIRNDRRTRITGQRSLELSQDIDAGWLVVVRDTDNGERGTDAEIVEQLRSITVTDQTCVAMLTMLADLLASPEDSPQHRELAPPDDAPTTTPDTIAGY